MSRKLRTNQEHVHPAAHTEVPWLAGKEEGAVVVVLLLRISEASTTQPELSICQGLPHLSPNSVLTWWQHSKAPQAHRPGQCAPASAAVPLLARAQGHLPLQALGVSIAMPSCTTFPPVPDSSGN